MNDPHLQIFNGHLYLIIGEEPTATVSAIGWATLYTPKALGFSEVDGLTAYTATCDGSKVTLHKVYDVPANTGVVLFSNTAGTYTIPLAASSATERGDLQGSATSPTAYNAYDGYTLYVLATYKKSEKDFVQFRPVISGSIDAFKAYLKLSATDNARSMNVVIADADGIAGIQTDGQDTDNAIFNLQGQRVSATGRGIYIVNGKKVVRRVQ